jgi:hypothetical protein
MSEILEIAAVIAIIAYVIGRQLQGQPLRGKKVVLLPVVLTIIGLSDLDSKHMHMQPADVALLVIGALITASIGVALGAVTRLENRNGALWGQLPAKGLWLWLLLILSRVAVTGIADASGAKVAAASSTVLLMLGINRLAQAAVMLVRATSSGTPFAPEKDGRQLFANLTSSSRPSAPTIITDRNAGDPRDNRFALRTTASSEQSRSGGVNWQTVARRASTAAGNHHERYLNRRHDRHDRRDRRDRHDR